MHPKPERKPKPRRKALGRRKPAATRAESLYMAEVKRLPCVICGRHPVDVHHCFCGRFSQARAGHYDTIPVCDAHHQGLWDTSGVAIHKAKETWERMYGPDTDYIDQTREAVFAAAGVKPPEAD